MKFKFALLVASAFLPSVSVQAATAYDLINPGTAGCTREKKSRKRLSKSGGEALRVSVRCEAIVAGL